ncbi:AMP-binding protein, partial [Rhodococcus sp. NPDC049939]|uniref:AMP-binding protein n=1 Tax=Rhodococcus sp. NPDC049939 TaxID=3155511 RepID=UPI0033FF975E
MTTGEVTAGEVLPLNYDQRTVLRTSQSDATFGQYLELDGPLDEDAFCAALSQALTEHGGLQDAFVLDGPEPSRFVGTGPVVLPEIIDVTASDDPGGRVATLIDHFRNLPMSLAAGPLHSNVLFRLPDARYGWFQRYHRIVSDEQGMAAAVERTAEIYEAVQANRDPRVEEPGPFVSPRAQLAADARYRESKAWTDDRCYWAQLLEGAPLSVPPPGPATEQVSTRRVRVPAPGALTRLARRSGGGAPAVLLAALALYWHSRTGLDDVVLGHRRQGSITPVRLVLSPHHTFDALTREVGVQLRRSRRHRFLAAMDMPAPDPISWPVVGGIRESLRVDRIGECVVSVTNRWESAGDGEVFSVEVGEGYWTVDLDGAGDLQRFADVLTAGIDSPSVSLGGLGVASGVGLVCGGSGVVGGTLPEVLVAGARVDPGAVAVSLSGVRVSYGELDRWSSRWARVLVSRRVGPGSVVALGLPRSVELVVGVWAVAKSGAAFVPVDPGLPAARVVELVADSGAVVGLTVSGRGLPDAVEWLEVDRPGFGEGLSDGPVSDGDRVVPLRPHHPAYLMYTSGSTGRPKGVVVTHEGVANLAVEERDRFSVTSSSRVS